MCQGRFFIFVKKAKKHVWISVSRRTRANFRACLDFGFEARASKFYFKEGKICSRSRVPQF
jgi:hypothetical protein